MDRQQQPQQQQQQQHQFLLLQQLQKQAAAMSRFPSNIDAHLRAPRPPLFQSPNPNFTTISSPNPGGVGGGGGRSSGLSQTVLQQQQKQKLQQQKAGNGGPVMVRAAPPVNQPELQMAYQDVWRVCHPDFRRPFASLEDACERLLPYHVVADYEAEEDDRILDSDTTGMMPSRWQQWDHNIAAKVAEFTGTFEKQALAFNLITQKRALGEFRSEERLMIEQALLQEEKRHLYMETEMDAREKAGREAQLRMAAKVQAEQVRAESHIHSEMMTRGPMRANALGLQNNIAMVHNMAEQEHMNGWGNNAQRDEKEPSEDFLNDEENDNGDAGTQNEWREVETFDLNSR